MAREPQHSQHPPTEPHPAPRGGQSYTVTFAGCAPITVQAGSPEEAAKKAAELQGVVLERCERPPDVVKVTS